jgi:uncharacterized protein with HEPN domain
MADINQQTRIHLEKILSAGGTIRDYVSTVDEEPFTEDPKTVDAVVWNLVVISRAVEQIPPPQRDAMDTVNWNKAREFSNVVTHDYFGANHEILKDIVSNELPSFLENVEGYLDED